MEKGNWLNIRRLYAPGCFLSASGIGFEPEVFLAQTSFYSKRILFKGKMGFKTFEWVGDVRPRTKQIFEFTHLILLASASNVRSTQIKEAFLFLKRYQDEILRLSDFPNVEELNLEFSPLAVEEKLAEPPEEIISLTKKCGLSLTW